MAETVSDGEIYRSARALIRHHGQRAAAQARARVDGWTRQGALDGAAVWRRILAAVLELQGPDTPDATPPHQTAQPK